MVTDHTSKSLLPTQDGSRCSDMILQAEELRMKRVRFFSHKDHSRTQINITDTSTLLLKFQTTEINGMLFMSKNMNKANLRRVTLIQIGASSLILTSTLCKDTDKQSLEERLEVRPRRERLLSANQDHSTPRPRYQALSSSTELHTRSDSTGLTSRASSDPTALWLQERLCQ